MDAEGSKGNCFLADFGGGRCSRREGRAQGRRPNVPGARAPPPWVVLPGRRRQQSKDAYRKDQQAARQANKQAATRGKLPGWKECVCGGAKGAKGKATGRV